MSLSGAKASAADRQHAHELELTKLILDWISVNRPESGNILVVRVPDEYYVEPDTPVEQVSEAQKRVYHQIGVIFESLINGLQSQGVQMAGAAVLKEGMNIEDVAPPPPPGRSKSGLILPSSARI